MTLQQNSSSIEVIKSKIEDIRGDLKRFVTLDRFNPIEKVVWTLVILVITTVVDAILKLILIP